MAIGGLGLFLYTSKQPIQAETTDEEQVKEKEDSNEESKSEARKKVEKMTDEEIKELINKGRKANKGEVEVTEEETEMLRAITPDEAYDLIGMTDDEVLRFINGYHQTIDTYIMLFHKGAEEYNEEYLPGKPEFEWIKENYIFEKEHHNESINKILELIDEYTENNVDALFSLKHILYELNEELNPESLKKERANKLTLDDAIRIQKGIDCYK